MADYMAKMIADTITRMFAAHNILFPLFCWLIYLPSDWRYNRNIQRFRDLLQEMINERRSGKSKSYEGDDLLSILTSTDFFQGNDNLIIDEIVTFFLAGMKTMQISTTNLIYYLTKHPQYKEKLLKEILPPVELVKNNIVEELEYDTVMEFDYL